jgi:biotin carboxyl carrier protein
MLFKVKLRLDQEVREHTLEVASDFEPSADGGKTDILLDGELAQLDWALTASGRYSVLVQGKSYQARLRKAVTESHSNESYDVYVGNRPFRVELNDLRNNRHQSVSTSHKGAQEVIAPMPGKVVKILSAEGSSVASGQGLLVIEAMKMQNEIRASRKGCVEKVYVREGEGVEAGSRLLRLS